MITLEDGEVKLINVLAINAQRAKAEFDVCMVAQGSLIKLIENKYDAKFNPQTGQLEPKDEKET